MRLGFLRHMRVAGALGAALTLLGACTSPAVSRHADEANSGAALLSEGLDRDLRILNVVAHQDDDLLFINPDIVHPIREGLHVQTLYVTAGNQEAGYWRTREVAIKAAYAAMAELPNDWTESKVELRGQPVTLAELEGTGGSVSLVFLRLTSFGTPGLQELWDARDRAHVQLGSEDDGVRVSGNELILLLRELMQRFAPRRLQVLNSSELHPNLDNIEHVAASRFAIEAYRGLPGPHRYAQYRGYDIYHVTNDAGTYTLAAETPSNLSAADRALKLAIADAYFTLDPHFGGCHGGTNWWCNTSDWRESYAQWLSRTYTVEGLAEDFVASDFGDLDLARNRAHAQSFRLADLNGDGLLDACIRRADGLRCAQATGSGFLPHVSMSAEFSRARGWDVPAHADTIQFGDLDADGRADVCGRGNAGLVCALTDATGTAFGTAALWSQDFSDRQNWHTDATYYRSVRLADVNGDGFADACGRSMYGVMCAINAQNGRFLPATLWLGTMFSDVQGWKSKGHGDTLQFGDIDGDGADDVCGRGAWGLVCALADAQHARFGSATVWTEEFSNARGWNARESYFGSIRLVDMDGDTRADACGRSAAGLICARSDGTRSFGGVVSYGQGFGDAAGFVESEYGATLQVGRFDDSGSIGACLRGRDGLVCIK